MRFSTREYLCALLSGTRVTVAYSLFWPSDGLKGSIHPSSDHDHKISEPRGSTLDILEAPEFTPIFRGLQTVEGMSSQPDCFGMTTSSVIGRCGDDLDISEDERVELAIGMTLCELSTAKGNTLPLECLPFSPSHRTELDRQTTQSSCVAALARSPQSWSSYSGYIRQVSQLCHAFRRSHDIDTARSLYRNATLEKIALLQAINQRETAFAESSVVALGIMDRMANILTDLQSTSSNISGVRMKMAKIVERNLGELFDRYKRDAHDTQSKMMGQAADQQAELIQNTNSALRSVFDEHKSSLSTLTQMLMDRDAKSHSILFKQSQVAVASMNVVQTEMADLGQDLASLQQAIIRLSTATKMSSEETEMQRQASIDHRHALQSSIQSLTFLASTMMSLSALTEEKMSSINQTAREVQRALASPTGLLFWTLGIRDTSWAQIGRIVEGVSMVQVFHIAKYLPYLAAVARIAIYLIVCLYGIVGSIAFGIHKVASYVWSFATRHGQRRLELSHAATPTIPVVRSSSTLNQLPSRITDCPGSSHDSTPARSLDLCAQSLASSRSMSLPPNLS